MRQGGVSVVVLAVGISGLLWLAPSLFADEHGGKEHGGKEHGGTATQEHGGASVKAEPTAEQIRQAIRDHIALTEQAEGAFTITDDATASTRTLQLVRVHERVGKTGDYYYSCTDMRDAKSGELLDLDFDVDAQAGRLNVADVRIHKVEGQARYTYDEHDNRVPLSP